MSAKRPEIEAGLFWLSRDLTVYSIFSPSLFILIVVLLFLNAHNRRLLLIAFLRLWLALLGLLCFWYVTAFSPILSCC